MKELDLETLKLVNAHNEGSGFVNSPKPISKMIEEDVALGLADPSLMNFSSLKPSGGEEMRQVSAPPPLPEHVELDVVDEEHIPEDPQERLEWAVRKMNQNFPNSPNLATMSSWKRMHGDIFIFNFNDKLFVYRYLKRIEWNQAQATVAFDKMTTSQQEEWFLDKCLLYPTPTLEFKLNLPAGIVGALCKQIEIQSGFLSPEYLAQFTLKV
jgi:hypothetical protein